MSTIHCGRKLEYQEKKHANMQAAPQCHHSRTFIQEVLRLVCAFAPVQGWSILRLSGFSACLQKPQLLQKLTTVLRSQTIKSTFIVCQQLWCAITRWEEGTVGQSGSKNILWLALIVSASVLLLLSHRQAESNNWKHTFKISTQSISFNQAALTVTDCQTRPWPCLACLSISAYCTAHVKLCKLSPLKTLLFLLSRQLIITLTHYKWWSLS